MESSEGSSLMVFFPLPSATKFIEMTTTTHKFDSPFGKGVDSMSKKNFDEKARQGSPLPLGIMPRKPHLYI
ncbi:hypothetical protein BDL97_03G089800 [Sphagnum fallax]|nr:hypothetical protein BDL97_03G089800 [Sphagnum fallax]